MSVIICDVDLTIIDTVFTPVYGWFDYLQRASTSPYEKEEFTSLIQKEGEISYDLSSYFPDVPRKEAFFFWQNPYLYQQVLPCKEAVEVLTALGQKHKIVFASYCKQFHQKSKFEMLKNTFKSNLPKGHFAFVATREKWACGGDAVIDDRYEFLNQFKDRPDCLKVNYKTIFTQDEALEVSLDLCESKWHSIGEMLEHTL